MLSPFVWNVKKHRTQNDEVLVNKMGIDEPLGKNGNSTIPFFHKPYERSFTII
jgi:hypothetical protein